MNSGKKRILAVYYSQTGQMKRIIGSVLSCFDENTDAEVHYEHLKAVPEFPFPWPGAAFFQAFPESVLGIPCQLQSFGFSDSPDYDLIVLGWQPWYLSPSIPVNSFLQSDQGRKILNGKPVITIAGSRNMWIQGQKDIKKYLEDAGARLVGNIVLRDRSPNLLSVVSVIRWLIHGKQYKWFIFPRAGVSDKDIVEASRFGPVICNALFNQKYESMQQELLNLGGVKIIPDLMMIEKNGKRIFRIWAKKIIKKGKYGETGRTGILKFFKIYLLMVIYLISPVASLLFYLSFPFRFWIVKRNVQKNSQIS